MAARVPEDPEGIARQGRELVELIHSNLNRPTEHPSERDGKLVWQNMLGPAMMAKAAGTMESLMALLPLRHEADAYTLLRTLYENVVTFCWIAIDPAVHVNRWFTETMKWEQHAHEDFKRVGSKGFLSADQLRHMKEYTKLVPEGLPTMPTRAQDADDFWSGRIQGWAPSGCLPEESFSTLRNLYSAVYGVVGSAATHTRHRSLDPFVTFDGNRVMAHTEDVTSAYAPYCVAPYVLLFAIGVSEQSLGWPSTQKALEMTGRAEGVLGQPWK